MDKNKTVSIKVIIIGEFGVGKTSLVKKFVSGQFSKDYRSSIGTNIFTKIIDLNVEKAIAIQLWDIAGQERWTKMRHIYYRGARGVIIVGDVARKNSFKQIEEFWVPDVRQYCPKSPIVLVANKDDLERNITENEIKFLGKRINSIKILFTSAKTGENVEETFRIIFKNAIETFK